MRLGLNWGRRDGRTVLEGRLPTVDRLELGTVAPPRTALDWSLDRCRRYGAAVRELGLTVGELGLPVNLFAPDEGARRDAIDTVRAALRRGEAMRAACVFTLVGSASDEGLLAPHPDNVGEAARERARRNCRAVLDGLALDHTTYALEPWHGGFFHRPGDVASFLDSVERVALHMDVANMHAPSAFVESARVVDRAFDLLADRTASVHAKDLRWRSDRLFMHIDEVAPGDGDLAMDRFARRLGTLPADVPVFVEHWETAAEHEAAMADLRTLLDRTDAAVTPRSA
jgi:sugar phosphate isomerase/epimerase